MTTSFKSLIRGSNVSIKKVKEKFFDGSTLEFENLEVFEVRFPLSDT